MNRSDLPDLEENAIKIRAYTRAFVGVSLFAFVVWKMFPIFRDLLESQWAVSAAVGLGLLASYVVIALDRFTDDYRRRLNFVDHFFFLIGTAALAGAAGAIAGAVGNF